LSSRDLKPANVLLESGSRKVKIADFGLAKNSRNTVTRGVGTPVYMPPEMFQDDEDPEKTNMLAVDVYAVAVILWQLWFKITPFAGKSVHKIIALAMKGKRPPLQPSPADGVDASHPPLPPALASLVAACWAQDANARPSIQDAFHKFDAEVAPAVAALTADIADHATRSAEQPGQGSGSVALDCPGSSLSGGSPPLPGSFSSGGGSASSPLLTLTRTNALTLAGFLKSAGLERHEAKLVEIGFSDVEALSDRGNTSPAQTSSLPLHPLGVHPQLVPVAIPLTPFVRCV
jgi:serine/threonine protein kinase